MDNIVEHTLFATPLFTVSNVLNNHSDVIDIARAVYRDYSARSQLWKKAFDDQYGVATLAHGSNIVTSYPLLQTVIDQLQVHVDQYAKRLTSSKVSARAVASWLSFYDVNSANGKHNHTFFYDDGNIAVLSINAIVYLQTERGDTLDIFWPNATVQAGNGRLDQHYKAGSVKLKDNIAVLMPSWVDHGNPPKRRTKQKICMSINYQYKPI